MPSKDPGCDSGGLSRRRLSFSCWPPRTQTLASRFLAVLAEPVGYPADTSESNVPIRCPVAEEKLAPWSDTTGSLHASIGRNRHGFQLRDDLLGHGHRGRSDSRDGLLVLAFSQKPGAAVEKEIVGHMDVKDAAGRQFGRRHDGLPLVRRRQREACTSRASVMAEGHSASYAVLAGSCLPWKSA